MLDLEHVHPRLRQRKAEVDSRRAVEMGANRLALINVLKHAIDSLDRETDAAPQSQIRTTIALYRWALVELEVSVQTQSEDPALIHTMCKLLDGASQDLLRKIFIRWDNAMDIE